MNDYVIITGATGMDGSHMIDYLLENTNYSIIGVVRHLSVKNWKNIQHNLNNPRLTIEEADLNDGIGIESLIKKYAPKYFINFAACSFVGNSWTQPLLHIQTNFVALLYILEAIRKHCPDCRVYQSGSSEMFGNVKYSPQDEKHPFSPRSIYGVSKCGAHYLIKVYRESYNLYAISGYLFNHESASGRRGEMFVTRKITKNVSRIYHAIKNKQSFSPLSIGQLYSRRDWSAAEDFMDGIWKMLNQENYRPDLKDIDKPDSLPHQIKEYVLSSNETHTVKEFIEKSFQVADIQGVWEGDGLNEKYISSNGDILVMIDKSFYRPAEVDLLLGDSSMARKELSWQPKINFNQLVEKMTKWDIENYVF